MIKRRQIRDFNWRINECRLQDKYKSISVSVNLRVLLENNLFCSLWPHLGRQIREHLGGVGC